MMMVLCWTGTMVDMVNAAGTTREWKLTKIQGSDYDDGGIREIDVSVTFHYDDGGSTTFVNEELNSMCNDDVEWTVDLDSSVSVQTVTFGIPDDYVNLLNDYCFEFHTLELTMDGEIVQTWKGYDVDPGDPEGVERRFCLTQYPC